MAKIGIDFGTTNSVMVAYDKNKNMFTYFNYVDDKPVPTSSTVWYHDDEIEIGENARNNINTYHGIEGHHFEKSIKLKLGTEEELNIFGKLVKPYKVAGRIVSKLKEYAISEYKADKVNADLRQAVFTVPIKFSGSARKDLRLSANEAGIEITTFIHEPFAAIIGHLFTSQSNKTNNILNYLQNLESQYVLTFDWGGGTLDITVVRIDKGTMCELGTSELTNIAGDRFDEDIANYIWRKFCDGLDDKYSIEYLEKIKNRKWDKILALSEQCKITLSSEEDYEFLMEDVTGVGEDIYEIIDRKVFANLIDDHINNACNKIDEAIKAAKIQDIHISHVLLTGGTCYIPAVQKKMIDRFGYRVVIPKRADLLIAEGAAVIAEYGWLPFLTKNIQIEMCDGCYWPMFRAGTPIGAGKSATVEEVFTCVDQRNGNAKVIVCEGISDKNSDKILTIISVPVLGDKDFGDDIVINGTLNKDITLMVKAHSKMVNDYRNNYSIEVSSEVSQLCFGLDFSGR